MPSVARRDDLIEFAKLIADLNGALDKIATFLGRPAQIGHAGEFIASVIFDIDLHEMATNKGYDGIFNRSSPLAGRCVNVKWGTLHSGLANLSPDINTDDYLILAGPRATAATSRGRSRPWVIESVYLLDAREVIGALQTAGSRVGDASSVQRHVWDAAMIYPDARNLRLNLTEDQRDLLSHFAPPLPMTQTHPWAMNSG